MKKVSLKDAFVRSAAAPALHTAVQPEDDTETQETAQLDIHAAVYAAAIGQAPAPVIEQPVKPPVHTAAVNTAPVYTATHTAVPKPPTVLKKKATFNIDATLHQRLKIAAAMHNREMVDIVEDALQKYLPALDHRAG